MRRIWDIRETDVVAAKNLAAALNVPQLIAQLMIQRGVKSAEEATRFLSPSLQDLHDPYLLKGVSQAVERLLLALTNQERVCIWGDYDVDGITSTALLYLFLRQIGLEADFHIPSRLEEGYGLNESSVDVIIKKGTRLLITVDCGTSNGNEIRRAQAAGMDVIVIDHHQVPEELPPALAVLNPNQPGCTFPEKEMAAVGVTFNLVMALRATLRDKGLFENQEEPNLREFLDLVSLGTIADIVPLLGQNRVITAFGLAELSAARRPGVAALKEVSGLLSGNVTVGQVAFRLAPRINAIGRLGKAELAVELLTTNSYSRALALARDLNRANSERQHIELEIFEQACKQAEKEFANGEVGALVLSSESWHVGVVGIVASRLVERFGCPVALIAMEGDEGRGSARGVEGIHLYEALLSCSENLLTFGGHRAAAGLTIRREQLEPFRRNFLASLSKQSAGASITRTIRVDGEIQPADWNSELVTQLNCLAPHGLANPEPVFVGRDLPVKSARTVGKDPPFHLKLVVVDRGKNIDVIGYRMGDRLPEFRERMDLAYTPEFNTWQGQNNIQLRMIDWCPTVS